MKNVQEVLESQDEPDSNIVIDHGPAVSSRVHNYLLLHDRDNYSTKPLEIYGYKYLSAYELLTSFEDPSTFQKYGASQEKDKLRVQ